MSMPVFSFKNKIDVGEELSRFFEHELVVGIHPFVGSAIRQWPIKYFVRLIDLLIERNNAGVVLFGGKGDEKAAAEICSEVRHKEMITSVAGKFSLEAFMQLVGYCHLFIGNISGPCHIAAAMKVPSLSIFGGAVLPHEWSPVGPNTLTVRLGLPCSPCYRAKTEQCPYNLKCLTSLWPEKVLEAAHQLMIISGTPLK
jgi:ADP-heptose:LPS heptosyltransferase